MDAVQITLVFPKLISTDPSACWVKFLSIVICLSSSGALPLGLFIIQIGSILVMVNLSIV